MLFARYIDKSVIAIDRGLITNCERFVLFRETGLSIICASVVISVKMLLCYQSNGELTRSLKESSTSSILLQKTILLWVLFFEKVRLANIDNSIPMKTTLCLKNRTHCVSNRI